MVIVGDAEKLCTCSNLPPSAEAACTLAVCELRFWLLLSTSCCETESDLDQVANRRHSKLPDWGLNHISIENHDPILDVGCGGGRTVHTLAAIASKGKRLCIRPSKSDSGLPDADYA